MSKQINVSADSYSSIRGVATDRGISTDDAADKVIGIGMSRLTAVTNHAKKAKAKAKAKSAKKVTAKAGNAGRRKAKAAKPKRAPKGTEPVSTAPAPAPEATP